MFQHVRHSILSTNRRNAFVEYLSEISSSSNQLPKRFQLQQSKRFVTTSSNQETPHGTNPLIYTPTNATVPNAPIGGGLAAIMEAEQKLQFPLRPAGRKWWFSLDPNIALFTDTLNPSVYLTFKDSANQYLQKVYFRTKIHSIGFKPEFTIRVQFGFFKHKKEILFWQVPRILHLKGGWDIQLVFLNIGWSYIEELPGCKVLYVGFGGAFGATHITDGRIDLEFGPLQTAEFLPSESQARPERNWIPYTALGFFIFINVLYMFLSVYMDVQAAKVVIEDWEEYDDDEGRSRPR